MKKLAGLIIILAVLVLGGYYAMGLVTEKAIRKNITALNQGNGLSAELTQYHRGFFCSNALINWSLHVPARVINDAEGKPQVIAAQDYQAQMPLKIHHGPIIVANNQVLFGMGYASTVVPLPEAYTKQFNEMFTSESTKPQVDMSIFVNYMSRSTINFNIPSFKLISKDGKTQVDWKSMNSTTSVSSGVGKIDGHVDIDSVTFNKEESKVTMEGVNTEYDLHKTDTGLYLGSAKFSLPSFTVAQRDQKIFELTDLKASSESDIEQDLFSTHANLSVQSILANGKSYGPGELEVSVRNLDAVVLAKLNAQANEMQNSPAEEHKKFLFAMIPQLPKLFGRGAELEISHFSLKLPQGLVKGNMLLSMPKGDSINPFEVFQKIQGSAKLKAPKALVKQVMEQAALQQLAAQPDIQQALTQQLKNSENPTSTVPAVTQPAMTNEQLAAEQTEKQLKAMEDAGLLVAQDSDYSIEAKLEQGKISINGKPYDPSAPLKF